MNILYGVQGTGNGHISRALSMENAFRAYPDVQVSWLLSSRPREQCLGTIETFQWRKGLSFAFTNGRIDALQTLRNADIRQLYKDINQLDLKAYDLVISDYEPVVSHAARKRGIPVIGIGHQYAFWHDIPRRGSNILVNTLMQQYAPVTTPVGLHWHHFDGPILPPIVDLADAALQTRVNRNQYLVYLPFENLEQIRRLLRPFSEYEFYIYHPEALDADQGNLHPRGISRHGFKQTLAASTGVITNSGFELISECLQWGKAILTKPLLGQMEQLSNAAALGHLGYATVLDELSPPAIYAWLKEGKSKVSLHYPDVAAELARWIASGQNETVEVLARRLWQQSSIHQTGLASSMATA